MPGLNRLLQTTTVFTLALATSGCYWMRGSNGGGEVEWEGPRRINPNDVALEESYQIEAVAQGFTFPTGVAFDDAGRPYVVESGYSYGEIFTTPKLIRVEDDGRLTTIATGDTNGPWNGVDYRDGAFFVAEGGQLEGGRILRITVDGAASVLIDDLPSLGDHHTNGPIVGSDGYVYFGQGTATNSAVVGPDNADFGWLKRHPEFHDIPCRDVVLTGRNFESDDPLHEEGDDVVTGAFSPFGTPTTTGQRMTGRVPCTGAIMRVPVAGGEPELVAWGLRNPFGLAFAGDGSLFITENSYDDRGSRPVWGSGDCLWKIENGTWYGWPDYSAGLPLSYSVFEPPDGDDLLPLLGERPNEVPRPVATLPVHASANGFDFSRNASFGYRDHAFIALFGDQAPAVGKVVDPVGFKVVRVDPATGVIHDFAVNRGKRNGPASALKRGGLERPVAARFDRGGEALYVVDFGVLLMDDKGAKPKTGTGVLWKITRK